MNPLAFRVPRVLPVHLAQSEAQNGHAHAEKKSEKSDDDVRGNMRQRVFSRIPLRETLLL